MTIVNRPKWVGPGPEPSEDEVREALTGNLCRCKGYAPIVRAILQR